MGLWFPACSKILNCSDLMQFHLPMNVQEWMERLAIFCGRLLKSIHSTVQNISKFLPTEKTLGKMLDVAFLQKKGLTS